MKQVIGVLILLLSGHALMLPSSFSDRDIQEQHLAVQWAILKGRLAVAKAQHDQAVADQKILLQRYYGAKSEDERVPIGLQLRAAQDNEHQRMLEYYTMGYVPNGQL